MAAFTAEATAPVEHGDPRVKGAGSPCDVLYLALEGQRPLACGARYSLRGVREVAFGRGAMLSAKHEGDRLVVTLPDDRVSSRHATLSRSGSGFVLTDQGSKNGTFVGLARHAAGPVTVGATFSLGACLFVLDEAVLPEDERETTGLGLAGRREGVASLVPHVAAGLGRLVKIAASDLPVLLLGESGTGKEVLARAVHTLSTRGEGPLVAVNSGALTQTLVEAQLFGHVKGAFSGAVRDEPGYFRAAAGGTLLLDEIGDLPEGAQAVLLRALETSEVTPVGATRPIKVDVRVVSATLRPVEALREDLRMRLAGYTHRLVPLRERRADLGIVIAELLPRIAPGRERTIRLSAEAVRAIGAHPFRLNVRELFQVLKSAVVLAGEAGIVRAADLPEGFGTEAPSPVEKIASPAKAVATKAPVPAEERKKVLLALLAEHHGNLSEVARRMDTTRVQVHRWIDKFAIDVEVFRAGGAGGSGEG